MNSADQLLQPLDDVGENNNSLQWLWNRIELRITTKKYQRMLSIRKCHYRNMAEIMQRYADLDNIFYFMHSYIHFIKGPVSYSFPSLIFIVCQLSSRMDVRIKNLALRSFPITINERCYHVRSHHIVPSRSTHFSVGIVGAEGQQESRVIQNADEVLGCEEAHQVLQKFSSISHISDSILTLPLSLPSKDFCIYFILTQLFTGPGGRIS